jgi:hypothetical protein
MKNIYESYENEIRDSVDSEIVQGMREQQAIIIKNFIDDVLGGLPEEIIIETLKEKFPENFL